MRTMDALLSLFVTALKVRYLGVIYMSYELIKCIHYKDEYNNTSTEHSWSEENDAYLKIW